MWFLLYGFIFGVIAGSGITLWKYKSIGISHPDRIEDRLRLGLNINAASTIKNEYLEGFK